MIFISDAQGTITKVVPSPIQQGANDANEVVLLTPLCGAVKLLCALPNGIRTKPIYMNPFFEFDYANEDGQKLLAFRCTLPYSVSQYPGTLKVQFVVVVNVTETDANGNVVEVTKELEDGTEVPVTKSFKTGSSTFQINDGVPYIDSGNTDVDTALASAIAAAKAAECYRDETKTARDDAAYAVQSAKDAADSATVALNSAKDAADSATAAANSATDAADSATAAANSATDAANSATAAANSATDAANSATEAEKHFEALKKILEIETDDGSSVEALHLLLEAIENHSSTTDFVEHVSDYPLHNHYCTCKSTAENSRKDAYCSALPSLVAGERISVNFTYKNSHSSPTICVRNSTSRTGYRQIKYKGTNFTEIEAGGVYDFVFDGTYWQLISGEGSTITNEEIDTLF